MKKKAQSGGLLFRTAEFKQLKDHWYEKLKESGFKDIEENEDRLIQWHAGYFYSRHSPLRFRSRETYYQIGSRFLQTHIFETDHQKRIWELHISGLSIRQIALEERTKACRVFIVIRDLKQVMMKQREEEEDE